MFKIAIASGKGGTGKTTLSANLSAYIAEREEVVLVDLDAEEPNSGLFLKSDWIHQEVVCKEVPEWNETICTLCGLCAKVCNFHAVIKLGPTILVFPELCHSCFACSELCPVNALPMISKPIGMLSEAQLGNLHFVESRLNIGEEQAVPLIAKAQHYVEKKHPSAQFTIFDAPPGTSCPMIEATKDADFIILITEPTPFGVHDLGLAVETIRVLKKPFAVVVNRVGIGDDAVDIYCAKENIPILAKIPNNRRIAELYSTGKLIYQEIPEVKEVLSQIYNYCITLAKGESR